MLWGAIILCILGGQSNQRAVWQAVAGGGLGHCAAVAITPEGVRKRLIGLGPATIQTVFVKVNARLTARWT